MEYTIVITGMDHEEIGEALTKTQTDLLPFIQTAWENQTGLRMILPATEECSRIEIFASDEDDEEGPINVVDGDFEDGEAV